MTLSYCQRLLLKATPDLLLKHLGREPGEGLQVGATPHELQQEEMHVTAQATRVLCSFARAPPAAASAALHPPATRGMYAECRSAGERHVAAARSLDLAPPLICSLTLMQMIALLGTGSA